MPQVGKMHFPYNDAGRKAAEEVAARTGQQLTKQAGYNKGGGVPLEMSEAGCMVIEGYKPVKKQG
jgi:hypothetical protein